MIGRGVILIDDSYNDGYKGIQKAVWDYEDEIGAKLIKMPIGDHNSIA